MNDNLYGLEYRMRETLRQQAAAARRFTPAPPAPARATRRMQTILRLGPLVVAWSRPA